MHRQSPCGQTTDIETKSYKKNNTSNFEETMSSSNRFRDSIEGFRLFGVKSAGDQWVIYMGDTATWWVFTDKKLSYPSIVGPRPLYISHTNLPSCRRRQPLQGTRSFIPPHLSATSSSSLIFCLGIPTVTLKYGLQLQLYGGVVPYCKVFWGPLERLYTSCMWLLGIVQSRRDFPSSSRKGWAFSEPTEWREAF
jgi:hypothetical protein